MKLCRNIWDMLRLGTCGGFNFDKIECSVVIPLNDICLSSDGGRLGGFQLPRSVDKVASLPRNASGKVLKRELREPYWAGRGRRIPVA